MPNLLIVSNCPSDNTRLLQQAVVDGATSEEFESVEVRVLEPLQAGADDVLGADGIIVGTTENFGSMSGLIKDFFERIYYPCLEKTEARPYGLYIKGGLDGQGAKTNVEKIITGLRWKPICDAVVMRGEYREEFADQCRELGMRMAAGLDAGIY